MDRDKVIRYLMYRLDYTEEQKHLIQAIEEAREELQHARVYFNSVSEPKLVDYAIHLEDAARSRYTFLLAEAKSLELRVDCTYMLSEATAG